jgi:hypothetical protein
MRRDLPSANLDGAFNLEEYDMTTMTSHRWARVSSAMFGLSCCVLFTSLGGTSAHTQNAISRNYDFVRSTHYSPDDVIEGIKNFAEAKSWQFVRTDTVKRNEDEITFVVVCVPTVAPAVLPVRMPPSVMPPCALIVVAEKADWTEVSVLHPQPHGKYADSTGQSPSDIGGTFVMELLEAVPQ